MRWVGQNFLVGKNNTAGYMKKYLLLLVFCFCISFADAQNFYTVGPSAGIFFHDGLTYPVFTQEITFVPADLLGWDHSAGMHAPKLPTPWMTIGLREILSTPKGTVIAPYGEAGFYFIANIGAGYSKAIGGYSPAGGFHLFAGLPFITPVRNLFVEPYARKVLKRGGDFEFGCMLKYTPFLE